MSTRYKKLRRAERVLAFGDVHWSCRQPEVVELIRKVANVFRPDTIINGGDTLNSGPFSRFPKHKLDEDDGYQLEDSELAPASAYMQQLRKTCKRLVCLEGNHDEHIERWLLTSQQGRTLRKYLPENYFKNAIPDLMWVPYTDVRGNAGMSKFYLSKNLFVIHGWDASKYAAVRHLEMAKPASCWYFHSHRMDMRTGCLSTGDITMALNPGCCCKLQPIYAEGGKPSEWSHGFLTGYVGKSSFTAYPLIVQKNWSVVLPDGREVRV